MQTRRIMCKHTTMKTQMERGCNATRLIIKLCTGEVYGLLHTPAAFTPTRIGQDATRTPEPFRTWEITKSAVEQRHTHKPEIPFVSLKII
jgi:hypothetical protein